MGYGQNLKDILDNKGMTVKELALKAKIAPTALFNYPAGYCYPL